MAPLGGGPHHGVWGRFSLVTSFRTSFRTACRLDKLARWINWRLNRSPASFLQTGCLSQPKARVTQVRQLKTAAQLYRYWAMADAVLGDAREQALGAYFAAKDDRLKVDRDRKRKSRQEESPAATATRQANDRKRKKQRRDNDGQESPELRNECFAQNQDRWAIQKQMRDDYDLIHPPIEPTVSPIRTEATSTDSSIVPTVSTVQTGARENEFTCAQSGCSKSFADRSSLRKHQRTHASNKSFKCAYCDKTFTESSNRYKHQYSRKHEVFRMFLNDICCVNFL